MTSILKVDALQKSDGTDGVHIAGHMIKTHTLKSPSNSTLALTNSSFIDIDTFNITTQANSKLIWIIDTQQYTKGSGNTNLLFRLFVDGVSNGHPGTGDERNPSWYHPWYGFNGGREVMYNHMVTNPLSAGSHEIKVQAAVYNPGTITLKFQGMYLRYLVHEIAG
jgi:hypothetical protein